MNIKDDEFKDLCIIRGILIEATDEILDKARCAAAVRAVMAQHVSEWNAVHFVLFASCADYPSVIQAMDKGFVILVEVEDLWPVAKALRIDTIKDLFDAKRIIERLFYKIIDVDEEKQDA